ncbi:MAG: hypothetical protein JSS83_06365 [Cyanobacteria bacterium SZAS LIN-3]|nr:hypothetical protein [Cyanobacteria bacterium SZAS LIN-3]
MQARRIFGAFFTILALHVMTLAPAMAAEAESQSLSQATEVALPAAATSEAPVHFKAGVKYDPVKHEWIDRYSNKSVDLGLPGLTGKYGANQLIADSSTSTTTTSTAAGGFPWKKFIIITVMIAGVATAIAVPIACGVHHHNNNANTQNNQAAAYYFFHNQTLPIPTVPHGPNPFVPTGIKPPPKLLSLIH